MDQGTLQGIGTILTMIAFLGICWWAFSSRKQKDFDEASRLPFTDEQQGESQTEDKNR
ncbi:MAG: cbb3-type cytochrome c oxidase subunit 3 [Porticoccaceae bacterium]